MSGASTPFRRVNPHPGMMIDVDTWRDAHDYHRDQLSLHHLALHGWGVIQGLEVQLVDGADNTLRIEPGMAIDSAGRFVIVPQAQMYQVTARERQTVYLVLQFRDVLAEPAGSVPTRVIEAYRIQERDRLPEEPYLELARIDFDPKAGAVKLARKADSPGKNELDLRSRAELGSLATPTRPTPAASIVAAGDSDGLTPRVDGISQQLDTLAQQVQVLTNDVEAVRQAPLGIAPDNAASDTSHGARIESLSVQVQHLVGRVEALSAAPGIASSPAAADSRLQSLAERVQLLAQQVEGLGSNVRGLAEPTGQPQGGNGTGVTAEQVSGVVAEQVSMVREHLDAVAGRLENVSQLVTAAGQREAADVEGLEARIDGMRHELDALGLQVQAVSRQFDAGAVTPAPMSLPTSTEPGRNGAAGVSAGRRSVRLAVAEHGGGGWDTHGDGVRFLARELSQSTHVEGQMLEPRRLIDALGVEVLYMSGHAALALGDADVEAVGRLLEQGGAVIGEGCAAGPNGEGGAREFAMSFVELANRLGRQLTRVDRDHPLMRARHVFGELPPGGRTTARVLEAGGLVYSDADYGCAWQGGPAQRALPRAAIRDALDFGINLALYRNSTP